MTKINTRLGETQNLGQTLNMLLQLPSYFSEAACSEANPQIFDGETLSDVLAAKKVCGLCPIKNLCLGWAAMTQDSGVWGGMTPLERKKYNRGNSPIDIGEVQMLETNRTRLLSSTPASKLAEEFEVTERTIYRWRKKIHATQQAS
jgi:WhiB family redox-sensing transcriptional regulator